MFLLRSCVLLALASSISSYPYQQSAFNSTLIAQSTTLIDVLSADPDYTSLLKLLQRALLVPTLNKLNGSTLFAPTNEAIANYGPWTDILNSDDSLKLRDNVQEQLRQDLYYHLLNYSISVFSDQSGGDDHHLQVHKTLHFPRKRTEPPSREPPPSPPWLPVPGEGTLGGQPQRLRVSSDKENAFVGTNAFGNGGSQVVKGEVDAGNGMVLGLDSVLRVPQDLASVASQQPSLSYLNRITTPDVLEALNSTSGMTIFLPVDDAWNALDDIERKYLETRFASDDIVKILNRHVVVADGVYWSESFKPALNLTTVAGSTLEILQDPETDKTSVSSAELVEPDIYASNGVLHTVSSLLIPPNSFSITPEKYLLTLNCTSFVSLLHSVELTQLVNDTAAQYTILAPADDVIDIFNADDGLPEPGSDELRRVLSYHFIPGRLTPKNLKNGMLLETALEEVGLKGGRQVLEVEVDDDEHKTRKKENGISFGGTSVLGEPYKYRNSVIYLVSQPILPPKDALTTALPFLDFSTFLAAVFSTSLAERLKSAPSTTFLLPQNDAFKRLGKLVSDHLLSASSKTDLESVILHHVIDGVEYGKSFRKGSNQSLASLEGSDVHIDRTANGSVSIRASGGWAGLDADLKTMDALTETGVIHEISEVLLPRSLDLSIGKLAKAAKGTTMTNLIIRAGMDWILNGTAPPEGTPWADIDTDGVGWTLLYPTDDAFKGYNITRIYENPEFLRSLVEQHVLPITKSEMLNFVRLDSSQSNKPVNMDDSATYSTLHSRTSVYGDVVFRQATPDDEGINAGFLVGIKGARGQKGIENGAFVTSWGRTTANGGVGGVVQIDAVLMPYQPPWWLEYGAPIGVGVVGVALIGFFFMGVRLLWRRDTSEATYEPIGGFAEEEEES